MKNEEDYPKIIKSYSASVELLKVELDFLKERYCREISVKDKEISIYKSQIEFLQKLVTTLSERTIINSNKLEANVMSDQSKSEINRNVNFNAPIKGVGYVEGDSYYYSSPEQEKSLIEAAQEIQQLLNQLSQNYPTSTVPEQLVVAAKAIEEIEKQPQFKQRVIGSLKSGGMEALKELVDNPVINVLLAALEGWKSA
jgi:hypothetical protein